MKVASLEYDRPTLLLSFNHRILAFTPKPLKPNGVVSVEAGAHTSTKAGESLKKPSTCPTQVASPFANGDILQAWPFSGFFFARDVVWVFRFGLFATTKGSHPTIFLVWDCSCGSFRKWLLKQAFTDSRMLSKRTSKKDRSVARNTRSPSSTKLLPSSRVGDL